MGGLSSQFDYSCIYDAKLEDSAYKQHNSWVDIEQKVHNEWLESGDSDKITEVKRYDWGFEYELTPEAQRSSRAKFENMSTTVFRQWPRSFTKESLTIKRSFG